MTTPPPEALSAEEIGRLLAEATPGEWNLVWWGNEQYPYPLSILADDNGSWIARGGTVSSEADARIIANAKTFARMALATARREEAAPELPEGEVEGLIEKLRKRGEQFLGMSRQPVAARGRYPKPSVSDTLEGEAADFIEALQAARIVAWREAENQCQLRVQETIRAEKAEAELASERTARQRAEERVADLDGWNREIGAVAVDLRDRLSALKRKVEEILTDEARKVRRYIVEDCEGDDAIKEHAKTIALGRLSEISVIRDRIRQALTAAQGEGEAECPHGKDDPLECEPCLQQAIAPTPSSDRRATLRPDLLREAMEALEPVKELANACGDDIEDHERWTLCNWEGDCLSVDITPAQLRRARSIHAKLKAATGVHHDGE